MVDKRALDYLREYSSKGHGLGVLKENLVNAGYSDLEVSEATRELHYKKTANEDLVGGKVEKINKSLSGAIKKIAHHLKRAASSIGYFFVDTPNFEFGRALKTFLLVLIPFYIIQATTLFFKFQLNVGDGNLFTYLFSGIIQATFFLFSFGAFSLFLLGLYYLVANYFLKYKIKFSSLLGVFLVSFLPYILINSFNGVSFYKLIAVFGVFVGLFDLNLWMVLCFFLFSWNLRAELDVGVAGAALFVLVPFVVLGSLCILFFFGAVRLNVLGMIIEKF